MDSISTARDFFINQQGLSPDQADMIVSKGMEAYNQQSRPQLQQNMMQMASGGIARLGYQMGGVSTMPMDTGAPLQVPQQMPTNFSSAQNITMNPLLNYGQPQLGQAGGTPLSMNRGGIARLGYQMGGEAMMQPQGMQQEQPIQLGEGDNALLTIIQLLIEQGIDPETAQRLARQILQIFAEGGEPAVEAFANQLEQQEAQAMASGGIAGYAQRQGYGFGSFVGSIFKGAGKIVKGVAKAVKSVAKSPIGKIALTIGATMLMGPAGLNLAAGQFGITNAFLAGAINAGAANLIVQGITTGRINPKEALLSAALGGASGYFNPGATGVPSATGSVNPVTGVGTSVSASGDIITSGSPVMDTTITGGIQNVNPVLDTTGFGTNYGTAAEMAPTLTTPMSPLTGQVAVGKDAVFTLDKASLDPAAGKGSQIYNPPTNVEAKPGFFQDTLNKAQTGLQSLYKNPMGTISDLASSAYKGVSENIVPLTIGAGVGAIAFGAPQQPEESDDDFANRQKQEVALSITQYGKNLKITNDDFYKRYGAVNPFAVQTAAQGGIMGYAAGGSMIPPARQIEGGVIELDARKTGGYIPYGKKERVDDVPAMLAKDEFVFTSRAVKGAGDGSARRGAAKMYKLMKQLETKGMKMERGARA